MLLIYDWPFLHVCILQEKTDYFPFSTFIIASVFSDYVVFYRDKHRYVRLWAVLLRTQTSVIARSCIFSAPFVAATI